MRFSPKLLIAIDLLVLAVWVLSLFFGGQLADKLHPSANQRFYQTLTVQVNQIYDESVSSEERTNIIQKLNELTILESEKLYGIRLNGKNDSLQDFNAVLNLASRRWVYINERTLFKIYLGEIIRQSSQAEWIVDDTLELALKSKINSEIVSLFDIIEYKIYDQRGDSKQFYDEAIAKLKTQP